MHVGFDESRAKDRRPVEFLPYAGINRIRFNGSMQIDPHVSGKSRPEEASDCTDLDRVVRTQIGSWKPVDDERRQNSRA